MSRRSRRSGEVDAGPGHEPDGRHQRDGAPADALGLLEVEEVAEACSVQFGPAAALGEVRRRRLEVPDRRRVASHEPVDREAAGRDGDDCLRRKAELARGGQLAHAGADAFAAARARYPSSSSAASFSLPGIRWP